MKLFRTFILVMASTFFVAPTPTTNRPDISPILEADHPTVISKFGYRTHPLTNVKKLHQGVDIKAAKNAKVIATANGIIVDVSRSTKGYGNSIVIQHSDTLKTRYAHLDQIFVENGQDVAKGQEIGTVGNTGNATTIHLHYEVLENAKAVDPLEYFPLK